MPFDYPLSSPMTGRGTGPLGQTGNTGGGFGNFLMQALPGLAGSNPYAAAGMFAAQTLLPGLAGSLFGNPEAERAAVLRDQSLAAIQNIMPTAQKMAKGELPSATVKAIESAADRSRQAAAMSATRAGQYGSSVARAQQQRASEQVQGEIGRQSLQAQQMGAQQVSGIANQMAQLGQQYALSGQAVDKQRQQIANSVASLFQKPDAELSGMIKKLDELGISLTDVIQGMIERGDLDPRETYGKSRYEDIRLPSDHTRPSWLEEHRDDLLFRREDQRGYTPIGSTADFVRKRGFQPSTAENPTNALDISPFPLSIAFKTLLPK